MHFPSRLECLFGIYHLICAPKWFPKAGQRGTLKMAIACVQLRIILVRASEYLQLFRRIPALRTGSPENIRNIIASLQQNLLNWIHRGELLLFLWKFLHATLWVNRPLKTAQVALSKPLYQKQLFCSIKMSVFSALLSILLNINEILLDINASSRSTLSQHSFNQFLLSFRLNDLAPYLAIYHMCDTIASRHFVSYNL